MVIASIFFDLTGFTLQNDLAFQGLYIVITILAIGLSGNLKWVAYLNFRQKWISILLILLVTIYLFYFSMNCMLPLLRHYLMYLIWITFSC